MGFRGLGRKKKEKQLLIAARDDGRDAYFKKAPWKSAKAQLKKESFGKCAYCDAPTEAVAHGDVEHFRPKSSWWWLACCYDNYVFSCQICNQSFKGDKFPILGVRAAEPVLPAGISDTQLEGLLGTFAPDPFEDPVPPNAGLTSAQFSKACKSEKAVLINPYEEDPETMLAYEVLRSSHEVRVIPKLPKFEARIDACDKFYGLNRETLCRERWRSYEALELVWDAWQAIGVDKRPLLRPTFKLAVEKDRPFAGMARYFVETVWGIAI
ncbi:MAG: hypothetical protein EOP84_05835 [Verrucomicrobiaceae bacterium]|nr:MAG: hypothetical protein EOP84_05835 [Verrucomicrobiaceae bacterium]